MKLQIENVSHDYILYNHKGILKRIKQNKNVLKNISFDVESPSIISILGSNGSGKSTLFKIILDVIKPSSGTVLLNGKKLCRKDYFNIAAMFGQKSQLQWDLAVEDSFKILKVIYKLSDEEYETNLKYLTCILSINDILSQPVRTLSLGQRMRCEVVATFLHKPTLVILDEATLGIDVETKSQINHMLCDYIEKEHAIILKASHDLHDLENVSDRIIILDEGKIAFDGEFEKLKALSNIEKTVKFILKEEINIIVDNQEYSGFDIELKTFDPGMTINKMLKEIDVSIINDIEIQNIKVEDLLGAIKHV